MPELPEVEITARRLDEVLRGARIDSALAPGVKAMRTFDPPLSALQGERIERIGRRGKHFVVSVSGGLVLLAHLMSAGRLQLYERRATPRDRTSRLLLRLRLDPDAPGPVAARSAADGASSEAELRLREFGSKQAAWVKLLAAGGLQRDEAIASLGPEAWPDPPPLEGLLDPARPLHAVLRDQHAIAGIGRSWVDEILWRAQLSPFKRAGDLEAPQLAALRRTIAETLAQAIEHYERVVRLPIPDKLPMPLQVHRHEASRARAVRPSCSPSTSRTT